MILYLIFGLVYFALMLTYALGDANNRDFMKSHIKEGFELYGIPTIVGLVAVAIFCSIIFWPIELLALAYRKFK